METTLATFRIDKQKWEAFKVKTGNASHVLVRFIDSYLENESIQTSPTQSDANLEERLYSLETEWVVQDFPARLDNIEERLDDIEVKFQEQPDLKKLKQWIKTRLDTLEATTTNIENSRKDLLGTVRDLLHRVINMEEEIEKLKNSPAHGSKPSKGFQK